MMKATDCVTEAPFQISWVLAKKQKPLSDGETVKECLQACAESLFAEFNKKAQLMLAYPRDAKTMKKIPPFRSYNKFQSSRKSGVYSN